MMTDLDPYVMYIVVRESLMLSAGKVGAQCGHAVEYLLEEALPERWLSRKELELRSKRLHHFETLTDAERAQLATLDEAGRIRSQRLEDFRAWTARDSAGRRTAAKIVLGASDAEFEKVKAEEPDHFLVVDNGHTEVDPMTETCLGLWPRRKSTRSKTLKRLRLYGQSKDAS
jgi:peptidyl-tRNA hydrolase